MIKCVSVLPFSLSLSSHGVHTHTVVATAGQLGGYRLIHGRYDLVSIQARLSLFDSMVEEAAACRTKDTSSILEPSNELTLPGNSH